VVTAARRALALGDVDLVLPYVHAGAETEVRDAFDLTVKARTTGEKPGRWRIGGSSRLWFVSIVPAREPISPG
jgi:hypothetical protein